MTEEKTKMEEVVDKGMRKDILWTIKMAKIIWKVLRISL